MASKTAKKQGGLGKGLDALFGNSTMEELEEENLEKQNEKEDVEGMVKYVKTIDIEPNKDQPRRIFEQEALEELSESIKQYGIIQPIVVCKKDKHYEIIAGERRWRASKLAGLKEMPVIIKEVDDRKQKEIALIENVQREDLNPIEKARGIKSLMDDYALTQNQVADVLGKSRSSIANTVRILNLDEKVLELAFNGKLTEGHCKALMAIEDPVRQYDMALYMIESGDSVREAEKKMSVRKKMKPKDRKYEAIYRDIENTFQGFFGTKVKVDAKEKKGKIIIEYATNLELERLLELIKK